MDTKVKKYNKNICIPCDNTIALQKTLACRRGWEEEQVLTCRSEHSSQSRTDRTNHEADRDSRS
jgi:hypothetical protein